MMYRLWICFCMLINEAAMSTPTSDWTIVARLKEELCNLIEPDNGLLDRLRSFQVILPKEYDDLRTGETVYRINHELLELIMRKTEQLTYINFLRALSESRQQHIVNFIMDNGEVSAKYGDVRPLSAAELRRIDTNRPTLIEDIDPNNRLLSCMETFNCISVSQRHDLSETKKRLDINRKLLDILSRRSYDNLNKFISCLQSSHQAHLIYLFTEDAKTYIGIIRDVPAKVGATVRLPCYITSEEPVDWRFQKDETYDEEYVCTATDRGVTNCEHYYKWPRMAVAMPLPTLSDYTLTIHNVTVNDSGLYHCVEEGGVGMRHITKLTVSLPVCARNPCQNNGSCTEGDNWYRCVCSAGFIGINCSDSVCASNPCQNNGRCTTTKGEHWYRCVCPAGFIGTNCDDSERPTATMAANDVKTTGLSAGVVIGIFGSSIVIVVITVVGELLPASHLSTPTPKDEVYESKMFDKFMQNYCFVVSKIDLAHVRPHLFKTGVITIENYEMILEMTPDAQSETLINMLYEIETTHREQWPFCHLYVALATECKLYVNLKESIDNTQPSAALSYPIKPGLLHKEHLTFGVWGLAVLDKFVYVALEKSDIITRYKLEDTDTLSEVDKLSIKDNVSGENLSWAADMVVDTRLRRLYISDRKYGATEWPLFTIQFGAQPVDPSAPPPPLYIRSMLLDAAPGGLSMSRDGSKLLVVCEHQYEYIKRSVRFFIGIKAGSGVNQEGGADDSSLPLKEVDKRIPLEPITNKFVAQAKQVADNRIVISKSKIGERLFRLYVIDNTGELIYEYGSGQLPLSLIEPYSVLVDGDGLVLVNDCNNERVVVLQLVNDKYGERLEYRRDLISKRQCIGAGDNGIYHPRRICAVDGRPDLLLVACGTKGPPKTPTLDGQKVDPGSVSVWRVRP